MPSVLFVCYANYCRSPMAEAAMNYVIEQAGTKSEWEVDSCGISNWHAGKSPDHRGQEAITKRGLKTSHIGRKIKLEDYNTFDYILGMDDNNLIDLRTHVPVGSTAQLGLMGEYDPEGETVTADCYYGDQSDFDAILEKSIRCCQRFYDTVMGN